MTIILTETGWENAETGELLGEWTNNADVVNEEDEIIVPLEVVANTLGEDDIIIGTSTGTEFFGISNGGMIDTGNGNDTITGTGNDGIVNFGTIDTGNGNDTITGSGGIFSVRMIDTGNGNDIIIGTGEFGIDNGGTIDTGEGDDTIIGTGTIVGILNTSRGTIDTGEGDDTIIGTGTIVGIFNTGRGMIDTGEGNDTVNASTGGFDGGGTINLGQGDDLIRGFGEQIVDGGQGFDTAELGIDFDNQIELHNAVGSSIDMTFSYETMSFTDLEKFNFNGQVFTLEELQDLV